jgi:ABC-type sugar transport system substrate-binding protein
MNEQAGVSTTEARIKGFMIAIKKFPNITVLPTQYVGDNPAKAATATAITGKPTKSILTTTTVLTKANLAANQKHVYQSSC